MANPVHHQIAATLLQSDPGGLLQHAPRGDDGALARGPVDALDAPRFATRQDGEVAVDHESPTSVPAGVLLGAVADQRQTAAHRVNPQQVVLLAVVDHQIAIGLNGDGFQQVGSAALERGERHQLVRHGVDAVHVATVHHHHATVLLECHGAARPRRPEAVDDGCQLAALEVQAHHSVLVDVVRPAVEQQIAVGIERRAVDSSQRPPTSHESGALTGLSVDVK